MAPLAYDIPIANISTYLGAHGWSVDEKAHSDWYVFSGDNKSHNDGFEIILPKSTRSPEYSAYVMHMIEILSSLHNMSHERVISDIQHVCMDVMIVRVSDGADTTSIPMHLAAKQIPKLKQLVAYAACSEKTQRAHYRDSSQGKAMAEHYRFGHTVEGSFGYRVESAVGENLRFHEDREQLRQMDIFENVVIDEVPPLERRVLERIVRGLVATTKTVEVRDAKPLVDGYSSGFNANMCQAVLEICKCHSSPIEYHISWSKKLPAPTDIQRHSTIRIDRTHVDYLIAASGELKETVPEKVSVEGRVTALSSEDDPRSEDVDDRSVIIRVSAGKFKSRKLRIALGKREYERADKAHMGWNTISVTGVMQQIGSHWHLSDPTNFVVVR